MLAWMEGYLERAGDANPKLSTMWLLSNALSLTRTQLYLDLERPISRCELDVLHNSVKRRASGEPLQYITGTTSFRHIDLKVEPDVLIPRPETEVLVSEVLRRLPACKYNTFHEEHVIESQNVNSSNSSANIENVSCTDNENPQVFASNGNSCIRIADIGTGSGCIACSLAFEHPLVDIVATDISPKACSLAEKNRDALGLAGRIEIIQADIASEVGGSFDVVVSNPPYIPTSVLSTIPKEVISFEPELALDGGLDGLDVFRRIAHWAFGSLKENGFMACELFEESLDEASKIATAEGFKHIETICDLNGRPRVIIAKKGA